MIGAMASGTDHGSNGRSGTNRGSNMRTCRLPSVASMVPSVRDLQLVELSGHAARAVSGSERWSPVGASEVG